MDGGSSGAVLLSASPLQRVLDASFALLNS